MPEIKDRARSRWRTSPRIAGVALATAAALAISVTTWWPKSAIENVATSPAQRGAQTLADGTRVELNAHTSLRFENTKTRRLVRLAGGEALFIVTKDPARPFVVETPTGSVQVTGTTFNVRTDPAASDFEVTVVEGSVQVRPNGARGSSAPAALGANDQFVAHAGNFTQAALTPLQLEEALAWREGQIVFRKVPLREALARFAHHHGRSITAASDVAAEPVGGRYSIDDLSGFLAGLELALPVTTKTESSGAVSVTRRPGS
jgi:transmembrane sensor